MQELSPTLEGPQLEQKPELNESQKALQQFKETLNQFIYRVNSFSGSKKQLQVVLTSLMLSPLNQEELHFSYPEQRELFDLGTSASAAKFFLLLSGMEQNNKIKFIKDPNVDNLESKDEIQDKTKN